MKERKWKQLKWVFKWSSGIKKERKIICKLTSGSKKDREKEAVCGGKKEEKEEGVYEPVGKWKKER